MRAAAAARARRAARAGSASYAALHLGGGDLQRGHRRRVDAVEAPRVVEQRGVAARAHVGDDRARPPRRSRDPAPLRSASAPRARASKPGAAASRRRRSSGAFIGASRARRPRASASISGCTTSRFSLSAAWIDDQPRADRHDVLDRDQVVGPQRVAGGHQVDDRVGQPDQRRELHRAVELDEVDVHALGREVLARGLHVLGRDADARAALHGAGPVVAALRRRPPCGSGRCRGRAAGRGPRRRARAARPCPRRPRRRRRTARRSARRRRARITSDTPRPVRWQDQLARRLRILGRHDARRARAAAASRRGCAPWTGRW